MGGWISGLFRKEEPPPVVLVPPLFNFPPLAARNRMFESSYDLLFGKLALRDLFESYSEPSGHFSTRIMLKPIDDPHVDLTAIVSGPLDIKQDEPVKGEALFRWQRDLDDPNTFMDIFVSSSDLSLRLRSCAYNSNYGVGAFLILPLLVKERIRSEEYGIVGFRYGSENISIGSTIMPFSSIEVPKAMWAVSKIGRLTAGVKYQPFVQLSQYKCDIWSRFKDLKSYSYTIGYGSDSSSLLSPSYNFSIELASASKLIASYYQHVVVQRRVKNPFEEDEVIGITNYIDFGFELEARVESSESSTSSGEPMFSVAASWQANKNVMLKGKLSPFLTSLTLAFKSWWRPSFTFAVTAVRHRLTRSTALGLHVQIEDLREASYQRADPNYIMLTPNKEHLAEGILRNIRARPIIPSDIDSGKSNLLPSELKPLAKIL